MRITLAMQKQWSAVAVCVWVASSIALAVTPPQSEGWRRYSHGGLALDLRDDWVPAEDDPLLFRQKDRKSPEMFFVRWPPIRSSWYVDFDAWVADALKTARRVDEARQIRRLKVGGLDAVTYTGSDTFSRGTIRETWIAVPDGRQEGGAVFRFVLVTHASGRQLKDEMQVYERMLASMRLDAATLGK